MKGIKKQQRQSYFCHMKVGGYSEKNKKDIVYPTHLSAVRPVSGNDVPIDSVEVLCFSLRAKNFLSIGTNC